MRKLLFFMFILLIFLPSCHEKIKDMKENTIDSIEYYFDDSSTPPRYHRSYVICIKKYTAHVVVDVYGTIIADETYSISPSTFESLQKASRTLEKEGKKISEGATGTKTRRIFLFSNQEKIYHLIWDSLNDVDPATLDFVSLIQKTIPNLSELKNREYPPQN